MRDFQARWESRLLDFSASRLFHSPSRRHFGWPDGHTLRAVVSQPVRSVSQAESPVQMLVHHHQATCQTRSPAHRFDLQAEVLKVDRVVPAHRTLELEGKDELQITAAVGHKRAAPFGGRDLKAAVELGHVVFSQEGIRRFPSRNPLQPQLLR